MSSSTEPRSLLSRPALIVILVLVATVTLGISILLALSPGIPALSTNAAQQLQLVNIALSSVALAFALAAARPLWRRRMRERDGLIVVCAWTRRVQWQGRWMTFEEYLTERFDLRCTHGICDEVAEKIRTEVAKTDLNPTLTAVAAIESASAIAPGGPSAMSRIT
jgi:hypothetical protein